MKADIKGKYEELCCCNDLIIISVKDVAKGFNLGLPEQEKILKQFNTLDLDKNGEIDFEEFKFYVMDIIYKIMNGEE